MTNIYLNNNKVVLKGHAGYGPLGSDIVCAGISVLAQTMAECLLNEEHEGGVTDVSLKLLPGDVEIKWKGEAACYPIIETGFNLLCENYPQNIKIFKAQN